MSMYRMYDTAPRPDPEIVKQLNRLPVTAISDGMGRSGVMCGIEPIYRPMARVSGRALTVRTRPQDNLIVHKAIELAEPGDMIIVDAGGDLVAGIVGDGMARRAKSKGAVAFVVDGAVRDWDGLKMIGFPTFARGTGAQGPYKDGPGEINVPVSCGNVVVMPGDIVSADNDGVVVIPRADAEQILREAEKMHAQETSSTPGTGSRTWTTETFAGKGYRIRKGAWEWKP